MNKPRVSDAFVLLLDGLNKAFGDHVALDDVSFAAEGGEIIEILGPNGSGKTTLLSAIAGILSLDSGCIGFNDELVLPLPERSKFHRELVGFASQRVALYPSLSVKDNLTHFARIRVGWARAKAEVERVADVLGLSTWMSRYCFSLSGGQARRVHVAAGFIGSPALVILDEPTAGMDIESKDLMIDAIRRVADSGALVLIATHHASDLDPLNPRVLVMKNGAILWDGLGTKCDGLRRIVIRSRGGEPRLPSLQGVECVNIGEEWVSSCPLGALSLRDFIDQLDDVFAEGLISAEIESTSLLNFYRNLVHERAGE